MYTNCVQIVSLLFFFGYFGAFFSAGDIAIYVILSVTFEIHRYLGINHEN
ncbi:hypothetical protein PRUB_a4973 [Pseudoalteromonas rubra]|uniref:Uncharacterized protein n=1 Tax=Pseudoalteromonas rubra TaxID=43658 RepID=A0A8T0C4P2_9GAMM|nr:hypothetical protein PRUB_a4973 [Pseudoalteromonas rubra]